VRASKKDYWRIFGSALVLHMVVIAIPTSPADSIWLTAVAVAFFLIIFGVWAALAPRGAAIALAILAGAEALTAVAAIAFYGERVAFVVLLFDVATIILAARSIPVASSYLLARRGDASREREYERQERWRTGSGW
jgi:hypothetical protein